MRKILFLIPFTLFFVSCDTEPKNKEVSADDVINSLKSPVILIAKEKTLVGYNIVLKDSTGRILTVGDLETISSAIGGSRKIGDTIR